MFPVFRLYGALFLAVLSEDVSQLPGFAHQELLEALFQTGFKDDEQVHKRNSADHS